MANEHLLFFASDIIGCSSTSVYAEVEMPAVDFGLMQKLLGNLISLAQTTDRL